jgi:hypothetical protein
MKRLVALVVFALLFALNASPQATAQITGRVSDPGGSIIPAASVQLTNLDTNAVRAAKTGDDGNYIFTVLPLGPYRLEVKKDGFQTYVQSGIVLQLNSNPAINVELKIGNVAQSVEVTADAAMVETQSTGVGQVIEPEQVVDLPLNGRQATQLIALSGAAVLGGAGGTINTLDYPNSVSFSVAGSQGNETNYQLDGSPNMDYRTNVGAPMPFPDALQEFKVESNSLPANSGSRPGGTVGGVTKGGTNSFHGDLFEFLRNGIMNADSFQFANSSGVVNKGIQDNLKRNQFGGVIGGPIKRNKLFFFYGFQGTQERSQTNGSRGGVPTAAVLAGDFRAYLAPPCQVSQVYLNDTVASPIAGNPAQQLTTGPKSNIILPQWLNTPSAKISAKIAAMLPPPVDACGNVFTVSHNINTEYQHVGRVDWQRSASEAVFVRYFIADYTQPNYYVPGNLLSNTGPGLADRVQNAVVGDTRTINTRMVNVLTGNFGRTATVRTADPAIPNLCSLGTIATCPLPNYLSYAGFSAPGFLGYDYENVYGVSDNLGWQLRSHHLELGAVYQHVQMNNNGLFQVNPGPGTSTGNTSYTGQSLADFMTGEVDSYGQGNGQIGREGQNYPALYIQDNWKTARRVQLNFGLRWDPYFPQHTKYGYASNFNLADYTAGKKSVIYPNAPAGTTFPGDIGFNGTSVSLNHLAQFAPRVGVVLDPTGSGRMSIRAGYGLSYNTAVLWNTMHIVLNPPWGGTLSFTPAPVNVSSPDPFAGGGVANPFFGYPGGNPFPTPGNPPPSFVFPANGQYVFEDQNIVPSHTQSWNVSVQRQISRNWLASATYIGNRSDNMWLGTSQNAATVISAGMTAPGIISTAGMTGITGPCTLLYGTQSVVFPTCNATSTVSVNGVSNQKARGALNLANPKDGPLMAGGNVVEWAMGYANYNGLLLSLQHRLSQGFSLLSNYTWSHCTDLGEGGQDITNNFSNPYNPRMDFGNCGQDRRHLLNISAVAQIPKIGNNLAERIFGGWSTSVIYTAATGAPFNVADGSDISLTGVNSDRPNVLGDPWTPGPVAANPTCVAPTEIGTLAHWYNNCAFAKQASGTYGNGGRNNMTGPGRWNVDAALWRTFQLKEGLKLDLRGEGFNVLNHANWGNPSASLNTGVPGQITSASGAARILQVAMKLMF